MCEGLLARLSTPLFLKISEVILVRDLVFGKENWIGIDRVRSIGRSFTMNGIDVRHVLPGGSGKLDPVHVVTILEIRWKNIFVERAYRFPACGSDGQERMAVIGRHGDVVWMASDEGVDLGQVSYSELDVVADHQPVVKPLIVADGPVPGR